MLKALAFSVMLQTALFGMGDEGRVCDVRYAPISGEYRVEVMYDEKNLSVTCDIDGNVEYVTYF